MCRLGFASNIFLRSIARSISTSGTSETLGGLARLPLSVEHPIVDASIGRPQFVDADPEIIGYAGTLCCSSW